MVRGTSRTIAIAFLTVLLGAVSAGSASATKWDPHVHVVGTVSVPNCGVTSATFQTDQGESGTVQLNGTQFGFDLYRVPANSPAQVTLRAANGNCHRSFFFGVNRPLSGSTAAVGFWQGNGY